MTVKKIIVKFSNLSFDIRVETDDSITIANAYQLFWRNAEKFGIDTSKIYKDPEKTFYREYKVETEKLDKMKVLDINQTIQASEKIIKNLDKKLLELFYDLQQGNLNQIEGIRQAKRIFNYKLT